MKREDGMTLIELAVVFGLIALVAALAVPSLSAYQRRQTARTQAQLVANTLAEVRTLAIREGNPYYLHIQADGDLVIVDDDDGDFQADVGELQRTVEPFLGEDPVTLYNVVAGPPSANAVPEDGGGAIPAAGVTFPVDAVTGDPGLAFNSRGFPISMPAVIGGAPGALGSGAGSYYVTDNNDVTYTVTLSPLGATRLRVYRPGINDWY